MQSVSALGRAGGVERGIVIRRPRSRPRKVVDTGSGILQRRLPREAFVVLYIIGALAVHCKSDYRER